MIDGSALLPLSAKHAASIAVLGPLADAPNLGDVGSSQVHPPKSAIVSVLQGLRARLGDEAVRTAPAGDIAAAIAAAETASAAVLVVGLISVDEGESMRSVDADSIQLLGGITKWRPVAVVLTKVLQAVAHLKKIGP